MNGWFLSIIQTTNICRLSLFIIIIRWKLGQVHVHVRTFVLIYNRNDYSRRTPKVHFYQFDWYMMKWFLYDNIRVTLLLFQNLMAQTLNSWVLWSMTSMSVSLLSPFSDPLVPSAPILFILWSNRRQKLRALWWCYVGWHDHHHYQPILPTGRHCAGVTIVHILILSPGPCDQESDPWCPLLSILLSLSPQMARQVTRDVRSP